MYCFHAWASVWSSQSVTSMSAHLHLFHRPPPLFHASSTGKPRSPQLGRCRPATLGPLQCNAFGLIHFGLGCGSGTRVPPLDFWVGRAVWMGRALGSSPGAGPGARVVFLILWAGYRELCSKGPRGRIEDLSLHKPNELFHWFQTTTTSGPIWLSE